MLMGEGKDGEFDVERGKKGSGEGKEMDVVIGDKRGERTGNWKRGEKRECRQEKRKTRRGDRKRGEKRVPMGKEKR